MKAVIHAEWDLESGRLDYNLNGALADLVYIAERLKFDLLSGNLRPTSGVGRPPQDVAPKSTPRNEPSKFSARTVA